MTAYKAIKVNGKKVDEHRYVMEQYIGRIINGKYYNDLPQAPTS